MAKKKSKNANELTFLDHLEELRWHLVRSVIAVVLFMVVVFLNRDFVFNQLILSPKNGDFFTNRIFAQLSEFIGRLLNTKPDILAINQNPLEIVNIEMAGQFLAHIKVSLIGGLILASPYIIYELWRFIKPALHNNEVKYAQGSVFFASLLFFVGILFGYFLIAPLSIHFLSSYNISQEVGNTIKLNSYLGTVTSVTFSAGVIFELPMLILVLSKIGIITPAIMRKYRKHAFVVLLILSAILTPPDVFSQILVCLPLVVLYELSVFISRSAERKRLKVLNTP